MKTRHIVSTIVVKIDTLCLSLCPRLGGIKRSSGRPSSVCLMSRTSALTRKPKGLGRRNSAQRYPRSHATPTPTSRSKSQKSRSRGGGILWRPPSRTACFELKHKDGAIGSQGGCRGLSPQTRQPLDCLVPSGHELKYVLKHFDTYGHKNLTLPL